ncbi:hypothetical protein A9264_11990 [Vibrio sp. UCD-FRSSP16_10]|uniref:ZrgA family zinc uptake protein n=1 Tax=unclassified Vibrio TaxID=2614977 RepID=UPI0007FF6CB2|nr:MULTISPECIES: DUF2796 domain-containing protein [unclassified Vibrio]OBT16352.1 hypothetical protein A9260_12200 [Vibrio sp. UCD-FRSSP16_30]OBT21217.1 hypothetical protein A9264_11990 [Vibrio sp. UCD-FRSSP16_10]
MSKIRIIGFIISLVISNSCFSEGFRQHGAHVHGYVLFDVAQDNNDLLIDIVSPGMDVIGFEHDVNTADEAKVMANAMQILQQPNAIVSINQQAQCTVSDSTVQTFKSLPPTDVATEQNSAVHNPFVDHNTHNNFDIQYHFTCQSPQQLNQIAVHWFDHFTNSKVITVNYIGEQGQLALSLDPQHTVIHFN